MAAGPPEGDEIVASGRVGLRGFGLALLATLALPAAGAAAARAQQQVTPNNQVQVWTFNTAGMAMGPGTDFRKFVAYITDSTRVQYAPDIVVLQEAGTNLTDGSTLPDGRKTLPSCHVLEQEVENRTPGLFYYCVETTYRGGAAILWRTPRFGREQVNAITTGKRVPEYVRSNPSSGCSQPTTPTSGDWWAEVLRLKDIGDPPAATKYLNVASLHLKTGGNDCSWENMKLLNSELAPGPVNMQIMAGDTNRAEATVNDTSNNVFADWQCWYHGTQAGLGTCGSVVGNLNWTDVMYSKWKPYGASEADRYGLMHAYDWSISRNYPTMTINERIDFIFTRAYSIAGDPKFPGAQPRTIPWEDAGGTTVRYSDHRGLGALLRYCAGSSLPGSCTGGA
jgi:hypothetical protein